MTAEGSRPSCTIREFGMVDRRQISLEDGGEILAEATISAPDEASCARAEITVAPGHLPVGTRQKTVPQRPLGRGAEIPITFHSLTFVSCTSVGTAPSSPLAASASLAKSA